MLNRVSYPQLKIQNSRKFKYLKTTRSKIPIQQVISTEKEVQIITQDLIFSINGKQIQIPSSQIDPQTSLSSYLRNTLHITSTKVGCNEGSCGACTVLVQQYDERSQRVVTRSINACLALLTSVHQCAVFTSAGLGNYRDGLAPIQSALKEFYGTQCGYCTPGIAVACQAVLQRCKENADAGDQCIPSALDMVRGLEGNYCRCTGYRPILDAAKSVLPQVDIQDLGYCQYKFDDQPPVKSHDLPSLQKFPEQFIPDLDYKEQPLQVFGTEGGQRCFFPNTLEQVQLLLDECQGEKVRFLGGNTGAGIFKDWPSETCLVSLARIQELKIAEIVNDQWVIGAGITIDQFISVLQKSDQPTQIIDCLTEHLNRIAGPHVRNAGTVVGNVILAATKGLESDIVTILATLKASVVVMNGSYKSQMDLLTFVNEGGSILKDNPRAFVTQVQFPRLTNNQIYWSTKVGATSVASHPLVNSGILLEFDKKINTKNKELLNVRCVVGYSQTQEKFSWKCQQIQGIDKQFIRNNTTILTSAGNMHTNNGPMKNNNNDKIKSVPISDNNIVMESLNNTTYKNDQIEQNNGQQSKENLYVQDQNNANNTPNLDKNGQMSTFDKVCEIINDETKIQNIATKELLQGLLYKGILSISGQDTQNIGKWINKIHSSTQDIPVPVPEFVPLSCPTLKIHSELQVSGEADYTADITIQRKDMLYMAPVVATKALAKIEKIDYQEAMKQIGFYQKIDSTDLQEHQRQSTVMGIMQFPIFPPDDVTQYVGQPIAFVIADTQQHAEYAARTVKITYQDVPDQTPIYTIEQAVQNNAFYRDDTAMLGAPNDVFANAQDEKIVVRGELEVPSQKHFYMEPQNCSGWLEEGGRQIVMHCASQGTDVVAGAVANITQMPLNKVKVSTGKVGGGFGGKALYGPYIASQCALAISITQRPIAYILNRNFDLTYVGGRSQTLVNFECVIDAKKLTIDALNLDLILMAGCHPMGAGIDTFYMFPNIQDAMTYKIPNIKTRQRIAKGNLPFGTAVRGPGHTNVQVMMEGIMDQIAAKLQVDPALIREKNIVGINKELNPQEINHNNQAYSLPRIWNELKQKCNYEERSKQIAIFNQNNNFLKRGIAIHPINFKCSLGSPIYNSPALVHIYSDGSILICANGAEMGQGLSTKLVQAATNELSKALPEKYQIEGKKKIMEFIDVSSVATDRLPNTIMAAGSCASEATAESVINACKVLVEKLKQFWLQSEDTAQQNLGWCELVRGSFATTKAPWSAIGYRHGASIVGEDEQAVLERIAGGKGERNKTGNYHVYGAACTEVELDVLTGERTIVRVDLMEDIGVPLNPAVDLGQVEGAFVMGLGMMLSEEVDINDSTGKLRSDGTWTYKIPTCQCIPREFNVHFLKNSVNFEGIKGSKAVGEPPLLMATSALSAIRAAISAATEDFNGVFISSEAAKLNAPATVLKTKAHLKNTH